MVITEPFSSIVALVLIATNEIESLLKRGITLGTKLFLFCQSLHFRLKAERKHLKFVFVFVLKQYLWSFLVSFGLVPLRHILYCLFCFQSSCHLLVCLFMRVLGPVVLWDETYGLVQDVWCWVWLLGVYGARLLLLLLFQKSLLRLSLQSLLLQFGFELFFKSLLLLLFSLNLFKFLLLLPFNLSQFLSHLLLPLSLLRVLLKLGHSLAQDDELPVTQERHKLKLLVQFLSLFLCVLVHVPQLDRDLLEGFEELFVGQ